VTTLLRHALSIAALPFLAVIVVPWGLLAASAGGTGAWPAGSLVAWVARALAVASLLAGLALFAWCVRLFAAVGRGTLAPWDPTRSLVAVGPYRLVRNPMISGVSLMLLGETLLSGSWRLAAWTCAFVVINHLYFILVEEPGLERRFGDGYRAYKARVPRWVPKLGRRRAD
jgi:protein-S-isoprenylcysteine O-methyltransferase Ste14